jgi:fermentation-respiration switch protein FrsA (DUF1100 family)
MHLSLLSLLVLLVVLAVPSLVGAAAPATRPATDNGWDKSWFAYDRLAARQFAVEETTPTAGQVNFHGRPTVMTDGLVDATRTHATPKTIDGVNLVRLRFTDLDGEIVPALLCTPAGKSGPFPLVIAAHGLGSNKAQVCGQVAPALTKLGFAVLAPDLPLHGERPGDPHEIRSVAYSDPGRAFELYRRAVRDLRQCIDLAESRDELDASHGVTLVGYSMGSWISAVAGPADDRVRAMALMVGGAHDVPAPLLTIPKVAACQPSLAISHFAPRPLLMINAKSDYTVTPEMGRRLFDAAAEPKELRWFNGGHLLPERAYADVAEWVAEHAGRGE